jgi:hypothetical protein
VSAYASGDRTSGPRLSIHVGLTRVDPNAYQGWAGWLVAPARDAVAMAELAGANGYEPHTLVDETATWSGLCDALAAARERHGGAPVGTLLVSFSGHGSEAVRRGTHETQDVWVLYDTEVTDDQLCVQLAPYADWDVVVIADCCRRPASELPAGAGFAYPEPMVKARPRWAEPVAAGPHPEAHEVPQLRRLVQLRACLATQTARDGPVNSLFTDTLLDLAWSGFDGTLAELSSRIDLSLPAWQTPRYDGPLEEDASIARALAFPQTARPQTAS